MTETLPSVDEVVDAKSLDPTKNPDLLKDYYEAAQEIYEDKEAVHRPWEDSKLAKKFEEIIQKQKGESMINGKIEGVSKKYDLPGFLVGGKWYNATESTKEATSNWSKGSWVNFEVASGSNKIVKVNSTSESLGTSSSSSKSESSDGMFRCNALNNAVAFCEGDGEVTPGDVTGIADVFYEWLKGGK